MSNKKILKLVFFLFVSIVLNSCNIKYGAEDSTEFYYSNKSDLTNLAIEFTKCKDINLISLSVVKDSSFKEILIDNLAMDEQEFVLKVRDFLKSKDVLSMEKSHNNKLILFHLGRMDGIAYKVSKDSYINLNKAFAKNIEIEDLWFYFLEKAL